MPRIFLKSDREFSRYGFFFQFFRFYFKLTILTNANGLIYARNAAILFPHDTAAQVGQICPDSFRLGRTPWELRPPKFLNVNAKVRFWLRLVTVSTAISGFLSAIIVQELADNRCAKYELPNLITVSTTGTWLPRYFVTLTQAFRYAEASLVPLRGSASPFGR